MADDKGKDTRDKDLKSSSAEIIADLLTDPRVRQGLKYLRGEEFKADRERIRQGAGERLRNIRNRYRPKKRTPETAARERELSLRLAEVESEAAELRLRLSELLEEEEQLRGDLEGL
jgi:predicted nuclease with TOPRIM domain